jgi:hypothetical protein
MLQYVDDTKISIREEKNKLEHIQLATTFCLINELKLHFGRIHLWMVPLGTTSRNG